MTATATKNQLTQPLTGKALLDKVASLSKEGADRSQVAIECGYYKIVKGGPRDGTVRADANRMARALLEAQGVDLPAPRTAPRGSDANRVVVSSKRRTATIVSEVLEQIPDVGPGSVFIPTVNPEEGTILLELADD